tara:strand:- start:158 stop:2185 length:2028 start_codon:yes stop_codon:yes gene_type:complete
MCNTCGCKGAETFEAKGYKGISASKIQVLEKYIENGGKALDYHELPYHIQRQLEMGKVHELLYQDVNRWLQDNAPNPHHAMPSWLSAEDDFDAYTVYMLKGKYSPDEDWEVIANFDDMKDATDAFNRFTGNTFALELVEIEEILDEEENVIDERQQVRLSHKNDEENYEAEDIFSDKDEAMKRAKELGTTEIHSHKINGDTIYMPFKTHEEYKKMMKAKKETESKGHMSFGSETFEARENKDGTIVLSDAEFNRSRALYNGNYLWYYDEIKYIDSGLKQGHKFEKVREYNYQEIALIVQYEKALREQERRLKLRFREQLRDYYGIQRGRNKVNGRIVFDSEGFEAETFEAKGYRNPYAFRKPKLVDTDEYKGHTPSEEWRTYKMGVHADGRLSDKAYHAVRIGREGFALPITKGADARLVANAPMLLEEVKDGNRIKEYIYQFAQYPSIKKIHLDDLIAFIEEDDERFDAEDDFDYYNKYQNYEKNGTPIEKDGYELSWGLAELNRKELIEEILGSFEYDYLLENNMVVKIDDREEEDAIMKLNFDNLFGAEEDDESLESLTSIVSKNIPDYEGLSHEQVIELVKVEGIDDLAQDEIYWLRESISIGDDVGIRNLKALQTLRKRVSEIYPENFEASGIDTFSEPFTEMKTGSILKKAILLGSLGVGALVGNKLRK